MSKMDSKYEALFTPWKIGNVEIKNRIVLCPMGGTSLFGWMEHTGNHFDKEAAKFFIDKAKNNVGLIIPGIAPIKSTYMGQWLYQNKKMPTQVGKKTRRRNDACIIPPLEQMTGRRLRRLSNGFDSPHVYSKTKKRR